MRRAPFSVFDEQSSVRPYSTNLHNFRKQITQNTITHQISTMSMDNYTFTTLEDSAYALDTETMEDRLYQIRPLRRERLPRRKKRGTKQQKPKNQPNHRRGQHHGKADTMQLTRERRWKFSQDSFGLADWKETVRFLVETRKEEEAERKERLLYEAFAQSRAIEKTKNLLLRYSEYVSECRYTLATCFHLCSQGRATPNRKNPVISALAHLPASLQRRIVSWVHTDRVPRGSNTTSKFLPGIYTARSSEFEDVMVLVLYPGLQKARVWSSMQTNFCGCCGWGAGKHTERFWCRMQDELYWHNPNEPGPIVETLIDFALDPSDWFVGTIERLSDCTIKIKTSDDGISFEATAVWRPESTMARLSGWVLEPDRIIGNGNHGHSYEFGLKVPFPDEFRAPKHAPVLWNDNKHVGLRTMGGPPMLHKIAGKR